VTPVFGTFAIERLPSDERRDENDRLLKSGQLRQTGPGHDEPGRQDTPCTMP
jgi:hypothetical protein